MQLTPADDRRTYVRQSSSRYLRCRSVDEELQPHRREFVMIHVIFT